jgi:hypothetical protein
VPARIAAEALIDVYAAALARPLSAGELTCTARAALAVGAQPLRVIRTAMHGAGVSNPDDPDDLEHREQALAVVEAAVRAARQDGAVLVLPVEVLVTNMHAAYLARRGARSASCPEKNT